MSEYYCKMAPQNPIHRGYHDTEYGFPVGAESVLFERLALEIMQAGLSWEIVLKKREALNTAFEGFDVDKVAAYGEKEIERLLSDAGIIRNRLKVRAIIANAVVLQAFRTTHGGFDGWLKAHHPQSKAAWVKLFRKTFRFMGDEIVGEFLMSVGYLPGAHEPSCPVYKKLQKIKPPWVLK